MPQDPNRDSARYVMRDLTRVHLPQLDGLRGVAVVMVMLYHYGLLHPLSQSAHPGLVLSVLHFGWMGVDLFFVLSGFLITGILLATRSREHYFRNFLVRRFLRIWPLYYLNLIVFFALLPALLHPVPADLKSMVDKQWWFWLYGANWLFAWEGGFNHTSGGYFWSLAVEEQFYLLWPVIVYLLSRRWLLRVALGLFASSLAIRLAVGLLGLNTDSLYTITFTHLDGLAIGAVIAICCQSTETLAFLRRIAPLALGGSLMVLAAIVAADGDAFFWDRNMEIFGYSAVACVFGSLLLLSLHLNPQASLRRILETPALRKAGKYSYALYLIHVPVAVASSQRILASLAFSSGTVPFFGRFALMVAINFALCWALAALSWHLFEKRVLALKKWFSYAQKAQSSPEATLPASGSSPAPGDDVSNKSVEWT